MYNFNDMLRMCVMMLMNKFITFNNEKLILFKLLISLSLRQEFITIRNIN